MIKNSLYLLLFLLISCSPKITEKTVTHKYINLSFEPVELTQTTSSGLKISVSPIDAKVLDAETYDAAYRDGNYEKEFAIAELKNSEFAASNSDEFFELRLKNIELINNLVKRNEISPYTGYLLKRRIWYGKEMGKDGSEVETLSEIDTYQNHFNPFYLNNRYLSVFKITVENNSDKLQKISIDDFQILAENELFSPYKIEFFETNLKGNIEKINNIHRFNMPQDLVITPSQKVFKYVAIPAINQNKKELAIQFIKEERHLDFKFKLNIKQYDKTHYLTQYRIFDAVSSSSASNFYVISYDAGTQFAIPDNFVYVDKTRLNSIVSIYGISVDESSEKISFGKMEKIRFGDFEKQFIRMKFNKMKE